jgi:asparagine N-glycosylation enzyme membrane subunit Stt3
MVKDSTLENRKEKFLVIAKNPRVWILGLLIIAIILGVYIRSMPMQDHGGKPGLWDISREDWTLGPDLDPWLFTRYAEIIVEEGNLPQIDTMRNVPLGFETARETRLLPYMIAGTYGVVNLFGNYSIEFAAAFFPVWMFALTILAFFLFVRELFVGKSKRSKLRAGIISLISTFFMIVIPALLSRTVAGIPEKESAAFFFLFLSLYLFLKAWKSKGVKSGAILGVLAGVSTAVMGLISGLVLYVFIAISAASIIAFILNKVRKKEFVVYLLWVIFSIGAMLLFSERFSLRGFINSPETGLVFVVLFVMIVHFVLWSTKIGKTKFIKNLPLPNNIISLIVAVILGIVLVSVLFGPGFIFEKIRDINRVLFNPVTGRWNTTVAENRQPYFTEWGSSFGPFIGKFAIFFWLFFAGSILLFKKMLAYVKEKDSLILTGVYALFFFGLVFSRYSSSSLFNGENFISKAFYYITALLLIGSLIYYYIRYSKENNLAFEKIRFEYLLLFSLFVLTLFTARSAVRLIMVLAPVAPIFVGYLIVSCIEKYRKTPKGSKILIGSVTSVVLLLSLFSFFGVPGTGEVGFLKSVKMQAYGTVPSYYNQQWQNAMGWVRESTPSDAVFAHWWDYGYWVQSIGNRPTVLDGGNAISFWNYYMGRLVLTGDNQKDALDFLKTHQANYLLIDSTDIGKYGAYSVIGSDKDYDRFSFIPSMVSDNSQIRETADEIMRVYQGGIATDEDIFYNDGNGTEIFLPAQKAALIGIITKVVRENNTTGFQPPTAVFLYNGLQHEIPLRYIEFDGQFFDFGGGLEGGIRIIQKINSGSTGLDIDDQGALIYISPRVMRGLFAQKYLLDDPFNNFPAFKEAYSEQSPVVANLRSQGVSLREFVYYQGIQGPIKIWKINYSGNEEIKEEYLATDPSKYLDWEL